jgi:hypothetical protein
MTPQLEVFFGGAAGPGKTDALLMAALQYVDKPNYAALILRRSYTDLSLPGAIMDRARMWLQPAMKAGEARWDRETHTFHFSSGAKLAFGYIATSSDKYRYQSAELQYIGFDELCEFPEEDDYTFMFSRLRRIKGVDIPLRVRGAGNPIGPGAYWVRNRFVLSEDPDVLFLPASFYDNPALDHNAYLKSMDKLHPNLRESLVEGNWDIIQSAAFPHYDEKIHVIDPIQVPQDWRRWEGMDYGTTNPTAWLAAALSPDGDTIIHDEYYEPGLISRHASTILTLRHNYWGDPLMAVCDPSIQARTGFGIHGIGDTIHSEFSKNGIFLVPANNDRRAGFSRISELLRKDPSHVYPEWHPNAGQYGAPRLYITKNCKNLTGQLQYAPLSAQDSADKMETVDPYWESRHGHAVAAARYLLTARVYPNEVQQSTVLTPRSMREMNRWNNWQEV